jgi:hypothetical protein
MKNVKSLHLEINFIAIFGGLVNFNGTAKSKSNGTKISEA